MRILFVTGASSIHAARWIAQLDSTGWDLHLLDPGSSRIHPDLRSVTLYTGWRKDSESTPKDLQVKYHWPFLRGKHFLRRYFPSLWKLIVPDAPQRIRHAIQQLRPDCIHSLEMQHNSYPVVDALALLENKSNIPWIYSCWGNDIFLYHNKPEHQMRIRAVLERCDYLMADCQRDEKLARNYGFSGKFLGVFPGGGGFPVKDLQIYRQTQRPSERRVIAVKGYQTHGGQALTALDAIERCAEHLKRFQVIVHSSQPVVSAKVEQLKNRLSIPIDVMPRSSHIEMSKLFGRSRVALGVSASDGTPNTMLEAMIMGAFPIQTNPGGATAEWVEDGVNGFLIPHDDPASIAESLVRALENDRLVDEAAGINYRLMLDKIDTFVVHPRVIDAYRTVLSYA